MRNTSLEIFIFNNIIAFLHLGNKLRVHVLQSIHFSCTVLVKGSLLTLKSWQMAIVRVKNCNSHFVKSDQIWSFFWSVFSSIGTEYRPGSQFKYLLVKKYFGVLAKIELYMQYLCRRCRRYSTIVLLRMVCSNFFIKDIRKVEIVSNYKDLTKFQDSFRNDTIKM